MIDNNTNILLSSNFIFCNFITSDFENFVCSRCGRNIKATEKQIEMPKFICSSNPEGSDLMQKIKSITQTTNTIQSDKMCSNDQIHYRYSICRSCHHLKNDVCELCGCSIQRERNFMNKLAMKNEECPIQKWSKEI